MSNIASKYTTITSLKWLSTSHWQAIMSYINYTINYDSIMEIRKVLLDYNFV
jgi:hypothetical protein